MHAGGFGEDGDGRLLGRARELIISLSLQPGLAAGLPLELLRHPKLYNTALSGRVELVVVGRVYTGGVGRVRYT